MAKITVGGTATLLAPADANRGTLTAQHIDVAKENVKVWVGGSDVAAGNGWLLRQLGSTIQVGQATARAAWYAVAESEVDVMVMATSQWDSRP